MKNYHTLTVKYLGATNNQGARIKITSERFEQSIILSREYSTESTEQAINYLNDKGFNIIGRGNGSNQTDILISEVFEPLK